MLCPDVAELEQFVDGSLEEGSIRRIGHHVDSCADCSSMVSSIRDNEKFAANIRSVLNRSGSPPAESSRPESIGTYKIVRELGRGGMGIVYEAMQANPSRPVALKVLHGGAHFDEQRVRLFRREALVLSRLKHPGIASIYEADQTPDGRPFFAMEYVQGVRLSELVKQNDLALNDKLSVFVDICDAIAYAHQRGIIHRDLKPSNVLVESGNRPKVLDFGLAKMLANDSMESSPTVFTEAGQVFGTVPYMSPEQASGQMHDMDVRSDVYSLGVLFYEWMTGMLPYAVTPANVAGAIRIICEQLPTPPSQWARALRGDLETIMLKTLEKVPERRYQSAAELVADIRRFMCHEPIVARPAGTWYQFRQFTRRNSALVGGLAIAAFALIGGSALAISQAVLATRERDVAERRLAYARQSADYVFAGVGSQVSKLLGGEEIRRHLTEEAYVFYDRIAQDNPDDPLALSMRWMVLRRLARQAIDTGNLDRAGELAELVRRQVNDAVAKFPDEEMVLREPIDTYVLLAHVAFENGDLESAAEYVRQSKLSCDEFVRWYESNYDVKNPALYNIPQPGFEGGKLTDYVEVPRGWAFEVAERLGWIVLEVDLDAAEQLFTEARRVIDDLQELDPTMEPIYRPDLSSHAPSAPAVLLRAGARHMYDSASAQLDAAFGTIAQRRGDWSQAERHFRASLETAQSLSDAAPLRPDKIHLLALAHGNLARLLLQLNNWNEAAAHAEQALAGHQRLVDGDPKHVGWRRAVEDDKELLARALEQ